MRFWDSSALLSLVLPEPDSFRTMSLFPSDPEVALWWATPVECVGALARAKRSGRISASGLRKAKASLDYMFEFASEIPPWDAVREQAGHFATLHHLRAADALQLAAAFEWCAGEPHSASFVCLDDRLRGAAALEGFRVLPYSEEVNEPRVEYAVV